MAKVSLARKKELNEPDAFIDKSNQVAMFIQENKEKVFGAIVAVFLVIFAISGYTAFSKSRTSTAFLELSKDLKWYQGTTDKPAVRSLKEVKERSDTFLNKYSGTVAGTLAKAKYAGIFYTEGDFNGAITLYEKLLKDVKNDTALKNTALSGLAYSYEALKKYDDALKYFQLIADGTSNVQKSDALFHLGIIYEQKGDTEKSRQAFEKIVSSHPDSVFHDIASEKTAG